LQARTLVKEIRAETRGRAASARITLDGPGERNVQGTRLVVTYRPEPSSEKSQQINDRFRLNALKEKDRA
jgi:hypothetical protein